MDNYNDLKGVESIEDIEICISGINGVHEVEWIGDTRVDVSTLPKGYHAYETRHGGSVDWCTPQTILPEGKRALCNYCGTIITNRVFPINDETRMMFISYC